jgi:hypothetical protein
MFVKCIKGFPGVLEEGEIYEVERITSEGNFILKEVLIPIPYTCFDKKRFVPIDIDDVNIEEVFEFIIEL